MLDKNTFGKTKACETLCKILNQRNDKKSSEYITNVLGKYFLNIKKIQTINDKNLIKHLVFLLSNDTINHIEKSKLFSNKDELFTYLKNVIIGKRREILKMK